MNGQINFDFGMAAGRVKYIGFKPKQQPDNYGNTHSVSVLLEGVQDQQGNDIFFTGNVKDKGYGPQLAAKVNGQWTNVERGDTVKLQFKQNGDFFNLKGGTEVTAKGQGGGQPQQQQQAPQQQQQNRPAPQQVPQQAQGSRVNPAEVGQCINLAVLSGGVPLENLLDEDIAISAIKLYKAVKETVAACWDKEPTPQAPPPQHHPQGEPPQVQPGPPKMPQPQYPPQPQYEQPQVDPGGDFDDDIPF